MLNIKYLLRNSFYSIEIDKVYIVDKVYKCGMIAPRTYSNIVEVDGKISIYDGVNIFTAIAKITQSKSVIYLYNDGIRINCVVESKLI